MENLETEKIQEIINKIFREDFTRELDNENSSVLKNEISNHENYFQFYKPNQIDIENDLCKFGIKKFIDDLRINDSELRLHSNQNSNSELKKRLDKIQNLQKVNLDIVSIRRDFPILNQKVNGKNLVWFDNAATTQKPKIVIQALKEFYETYNSNIHRGAHSLAAKATDAYEDARKKIQKFISAKSPDDIIFVRGTTEGINLIASTYGRHHIKEGDEILLSELEHHANIVPWQLLAQEKKARIRVIPSTKEGEIDLHVFESLLNEKTKILSISHANNSLGTILPIKKMIQIARKYDLKVVIDAAQSISHLPVNVQDLDCDFLSFSGHKIFSPTGIGIVYAEKSLMDNLPPYHGGGNMIKDVRFEKTIYQDSPARFEAGTPNIGDAIALGYAIDYVESLGKNAIIAYEHELERYTYNLISEFKDIQIIGNPKNKVSLLSLHFKDLDSEKVGKYLDSEGIAVRSGHHCAQPSLRKFGLETTVRPSFCFYNTKEEIDHLVKVLRRIVK
jgi:cysteine desulfurase/selenocysteine lyase